MCDCGCTKTERNGKCASYNRLERKAAAIAPSDNNSYAAIVEFLKWYNNSQKK